MLKHYLLQLMLTKGIGDVTIKRFLNYVVHTSATELEEFVTSYSKQKSVLKVSEDHIDIIHQNKVQAEFVLKKLIDQNIEMITELDTIYPKQLSQVLGKQCPPVLFAKGNLELLSSPSVGFCGSRKVSSKGLEITSLCASQLVKHDIVVVSGYAAGTDLAAHTTAMTSGGSTIFVLAEGIFQHSIKQSIKNYLTPQNHLFISQFLPSALWNVGNAMKRNSLIIGLSKAMILVESGKSGGTFAAGEEAIKRKQPLFVIDYAKPEVSAEANPYFIECGGLPIRGKDGIPVLDRVFQAVETISPLPRESQQLRFNLNS